MTILLVLIAVVAAASSISGGRVVQVRSYGSPGLIAGVFGCLFGLLGIFTLGIIFVPLAVLCGLVGLLRGVGAFGLAGIGTSSLALILSVIGFMTSPILWGVTASLLAGYLVHSGSPHLDLQKSFPHVVARPNSETWKPEDGYVWLQQPPKGDLRVQWQPGRPSEKFQHVVTASAEERWFPEDGYVWDVDPPVPNDLRVHWQVGKLSTKYAHVITAPAEGHWLPEAGFKWIIDPPVPGDFRVKPISVSDERNNLTLTDNQQKAGCSIFKNELLCPGPGTGLCWAQGHDPYRDESPMAIDVGNQASDLYGQTQRCSRYPKSSQSDEDSDYRKEAEVAIDHENKIAQPLTGYNLARRLIGIDPLNPERAFLFQRKQER